MGEESIMSAKAHGTSANEVQAALRFGVDRKVADKICNFNRHYAEHSGYWLSCPQFAEAVNAGPVEFFDPNTGKRLFFFPGSAGRSAKDVLAESKSHGWPSFRDDEVDWDNVRVLKDGETVSLAGTHLGHLIPDKRGNRYCINLVSISGNKK
jgi:hypothetical protein